MTNANGVDVETWRKRFYSTNQDGEKRWSVVDGAGRDVAGRLLEADADRIIADHQVAARVPTLERALQDLNYLLDRVESLAELEQYAGRIATFLVHEREAFRQKQRAALTPAGGTP